MDDHRLDRAKTQSRVGNYIFCSAFIVLGVFMLATIKLQNYALMSEYSLGPGFFPLCIATLLIAIGIMMLLLTRRGAYDRKGEILPEKAALIRQGLMVALTVIALLLIERLGMVLTIALYFLCLSRFVCKKSWKESIISAIVATIGIYVVFRLCFKVKFPTGIFGF